MKDSNLSCLIVLVLFGTLVIGIIGIISARPGPKDDVETDPILIMTIPSTGHRINKLKVEGGWLYYVHAPGIGVSSSFVPDSSVINSTVETDSVK